MEDVFVLTIQSRTAPMPPLLESTWVTVVRTVIHTLAVIGNSAILPTGSVTRAEVTVIGILTGVIVGIGGIVTVVALHRGVTPLIIGVAGATQGVHPVEAALPVLVITMHPRVRLLPRVNSLAGKRFARLNANVACLHLVKREEKKQRSKAMFDQVPSFWKVSFIVSGVKPLKFNTVYLLHP